MAQASVHLSDCFYPPGDHHHGVHFCRPEQNFIKEVQGTTDTLSEQFTGC